MKMPSPVAALLATLASSLALAQPGASTGPGSAYPDKPIRVIVPFTAGSGTDIVARTVGEYMSRSLKQPVVIENRPGAGGTLGAAQVAKAAPDGYTLLVHSAGHVANPAIYPDLPYDTLRDFSGVTPLASLPNVLVVAPAKGYKGLQDLVDRARSNPGVLNYATAGHGSATHMNTEIFRMSARFDATHVPFKGTPEAMTETATGRVDFFFAPLSPALPLIKDGRLQPLAVGTLSRSPLLPDVPTTTEAGFAHSDYVFW
jgi:tripartite-type tricarboxylate transporter receptor subunit TctC